MKRQASIGAMLAVFIVSSILSGKCYAIDSANSDSTKLEESDLSVLQKFFHSNQLDYRSGKKIQYPECVTPTDCINAYGNPPPGFSYLCTDGLCVGTGPPVDHGAEPPSCREIGEANARQLCEELDGVLQDTPRILCLIDQCAHEYECVLHRTGSPEQARAAYDVCIDKIIPRPEQGETCFTIFISMSEIQVRRQIKFSDYLNCVSAVFADCTALKSELTELDSLIDQLKALRRFLGCSPDGE